MSGRIPRICFVGLDNYPVLNPAFGGEYFGGESVQQTLLAQAFVELGYDVSMIVKDHGQPQGERIAGIAVYKCFDERAGIPVLRFIHPRLTGIWRALQLADADIYYQSCAGSVTGYVARFCRHHDRRFVFRLAHDSDCIPGEQIIDYWRDRKIYEYGLRRADLVAAQGTHQVALLKRHYGLASTPVNMAVQLPDPAAVNGSRRDIDVLWVNNLRAFKRPDLLLEVARRLPQYRFVMIGGEVRDFATLYRAIAAQAAEIPNLDFLGAVPYAEVNEFFLRTKMFLNTSDQEGFPNSFLQAWVRRVPVISFFDPDGLIAERGLGAVPADLDGMVGMLAGWLGNEEPRNTVAERARAFVLQHYAPVAVAQAYQHLLCIDI